MATAQSSTVPREAPPFIATQRVLLLDEGVPNPRDHLHPANFRVSRRDSEEAGRDASQFWHETDRRELFLEHSWDRLCLTTDAGIGKSTTLQWVQNSLQERDRHLLALFVELRDLPTRSGDFLPPNPGTRRGSRKNRSALSKAFCNVPGNAALDEHAVGQLLRRLIAQRRLVLLVDAVDQSQALKAKGANPKILALREFLRGEGRGCRILVAGRPHAIERYWDDLFADDPWRFAQLDHFNDKEQRAYLGDQRYRLLKNLDLDILVVPRALEVIRNYLTLDQLAALQTGSDVYWKCIESMLHCERRSDVRGAPLQADEAQWLLAALAFQMVREGNFEGITEGAFPGFCKRLWERRGKECPCGSSQRQFTSALKRLGQANEMLEHGFLEGWGLKQVFWRNRTLQEFFAALWLAKFAEEEEEQDEEDRAWWGEHLVPDDSTTKDYYWIWRFAAEMPEAGRSPLRWITSMTPLYRPGDGTVAGTRRSCELIYRSWETMESYAAPARKKEERFPGTHLVEGTNTPGRKELARPHEELAWETLVGYQAEFEEEILSGLRDQAHPRGAGEQSAQELAESIRDGFVQIPPAEIAVPVEFEMGSAETEVGRFDNEAQHPVGLTQRYSLARCQTTNGQFELFEPGHQERRDEHSRVDEQPATRVSWYEAWCFAKWVCWEGRSCVLPTEAQWEYGCRAGSDGAYCRIEDLEAHAGYRDLDSEEELRLVAHFDQDWESGVTLPVKSLRPNYWGLYQMHGNVWEWCGDWYAEYATAPSLLEDPAGSATGSFRVIRGGSWLVGSVDCRSAFRGWLTPEYRYIPLGFRLALSSVRSGSE